MTREENSKVAFKWHYGKNPNRTVEKQTNKQTKQRPKKRSPNFQKAAGNVRVRLSEAKRRVEAKYIFKVIQFNG